MTLLITTTADHIKKRSNWEREEVFFTVGHHPVILDLSGDAELFLAKIFLIFSNFHISSGRSRVPITQIIIWEFAERSNGGGSDLMKYVVISSG